MPSRKGASRESWSGIAALCAFVSLAAVAGPAKKSKQPQPAVVQKQQSAAPAVEPVEPAPLVEETPRVTVLKAAPDLAPPPPPSEVPAAEVVVAPASQQSAKGATLLLGVRAGASVPLNFLGPGYVAGLEAQYRLPVVDGRLRLGLFGGRAENAGKGARIVPGRGYDPAFIQNVVSYPVELMLHGELLRDDAQAVTIGAGYGAIFTRSQFEAVGAQSAQSSVGHAFLAQLSYRRHLGPGEAAIGVQGRFGGASFGALGQVGTQSLSAVEASLSWAVAVLP